MTQKERYGIADLLSIMDMLRAPGGCPWDREQTHQSIRRNLIEETYEVVEAIDTEDTDLLKEELGDVLLQVVFHACMEKEAGRFDFDDVCDGICKKLILRHPHIFSDVVADTTQEVLQNWDAIKRIEKQQSTAASTLDGVSKALPALMRSEKVQSRAAKAGFDYEHETEAFADLVSEVAELQEAITSEDAAMIEEELGDVLFAAVNVSRFARVDAEKSLSASCDKFVKRFRTVEQLALERGIDMQTATMDLLNSLWKEAKNKK